VLSTCRGDSLILYNYIDISVKSFDPNDLVLDASVAIANGFLGLVWVKIGILFACMLSLSLKFLDLLLLPVDCLF
jgi:hypothetical protein